MKLIQKRQDGTPRISIDYLGTMLQQLGVDNVSGRLALEGVEVLGGRSLGGGLGAAVDEIP